MSGLKGLWSIAVTHFSGARVHDLRILAGAGDMIIAYPRIAYPKDWSDSRPWFVSVMMVCTLIGFGCMTLVGLL